MNDLGPTNVVLWCIVFELALIGFFLAQIMEKMP